MKISVRAVSFSLYIETACRILPQPFRPRNILLAERTHPWLHQDIRKSAPCRGKTMHPPPHQVHDSECQTRLPVWIRFCHRNQYSPQSIVLRSRALQRIIQFRDKCTVFSQLIEHIVFQAAGTIHIPETVPHQILDFPVFILFLQPYNQIIIMTDLRNIYVNLSSILYIIFSPVWQPQPYFWGWRQSQAHLWS